MSNVEKEIYEYPILLAVAYDDKGNALDHLSGRGFEDEETIYRSISQELKSKYPKAVRIDIHILKGLDFVRTWVIPISDEEKSKFV